MKGPTHSCGLRDSRTLFKVRIGHALRPRWTRGSLVTDVSLQIHRSARRERICPVSSKKRAREQAVLLLTRRRRRRPPAGLGKRYYFSAENLPSLSPSKKPQTRAARASGLRRRRPRHPRRGRPQWTARSRLRRTRSRRAGCTSPIIVAAAKAAAAAA